MARIIKVRDMHVQNIAEYTRDAFAEFPEEALPEPTTEEVAEEALPEPSPEEIREAILTEAREEAARKVQEAYAEGHRRGLEAGEEAFRASIAEARATLDAAALALQQTREAFLESLEPQVVNLVTEMARRVLENELSTDLERVRTSARRALSRIADQQRVLLRVHPDDLQAMREHKITLLEEFDGVPDIRIEPSDEIPSGSCIAVTDTLEVDARWDTLFNNLLEDMLE